jgi:hypothetical protein
MGFLSKLCGCCQRSEGGAEAGDASYTRIVEAKCPSPRTSIPVPAHGAGQLRHPTRGTNSSDPLIEFDEKHLIDEERPSSSQSSIVSIPSTHITIMTASRNGASASNRQSYDSYNLGPPPSYHSRRTASPSPSNDDMFPEHPVMAPDWLERLRTQARVDSDPFGDGSALFEVPLDTESLL